jgi:hypothetical protein
MRHSVRCEAEVIAGLGMKTYEIRVMRGDRPAPDVYSGSHLNDHAAVRRAMMLAQRRQWIEVWCGARCVYAGTATISKPQHQDVSHRASIRP